MDATQLIDYLKNNGKVKVSLTRPDNVSREVVCTLMSGVATEPSPMSEIVLFTETPAGSDSPKQRLYVWEVNEKMWVKITPQNATAAEAIA